MCLDDVSLAVLHFQVVLKTQLALQKHRNLFINKLWCSLLATVLQMRSPFFKWEQTSFLLIHMDCCHWSWVRHLCLEFQRKRILAVDMSTQKLQHQLQCNVSSTAFLDNQVDWERYHPTPQENGAEQSRLQKWDAWACSEVRVGKAKHFVIFRLANSKLPWYRCITLCWFSGLLIYGLKKHLFLFVIHLP